MAQVLIRKLDDKIVEELKHEAALNGRSMQAEAARLLTEILEKKRRERDFWKRADEIRDSLRGRRHSDSAEIIREGRENDWDEPE
ncbi:MAG TPA: hypothetical protein VJQ83_07490 [Tepidiformaceae bacterium]|nr:hypothetical protein [Tepidiformaceae bacterium]